MIRFENASFVPFDQYVRQAMKRRVKESPGRRATDFTDAVIVSESPIDNVPEFADTIPMPITIYPAIDVAVADDLIGLDDVLEAKLTRARDAVANRAFQECLHAGYFPPRCQSCAR